MEEPKLTILGVYLPQISPETWQEQWEVTDDDEETKAHFDQLVLIEASVVRLAEPFDCGKLGQMYLAYPDDPSYMQVGYHEGLLTSDGEALISREMNCLQEVSGPMRFAVYLHFYDPARPLLWQRGEVTCPPVSNMPTRLLHLMPYVAI